MAIFPTLLMTPPSFAAAFLLLSFPLYLNQREPSPCLQVDQAARNASGSPRQRKALLFFAVGERDV
jgi:hypothetical protein